MVEAVVSSAVSWITDLLIQEANLLYGVHDQVEDLLRELRQMQCFLKDADAKQDEQLAIRNLVDEIREVAYEAENVISAFLFQVDEPKRKGVGRFLPNFGSIFRDRHNTGSDINTIKDKITGLTAKFPSYGIIAIARQGSSSAVPSPPLFRRTYSHVVDEDFVGSEPDIKKILSHLVGEEARNHRAISICGMGGLGKTTLARMVYYHRDVRSHFEAFAWVSISQQWQLTDVLQRILTKLIPEKNLEIVKMIQDHLVKLLFEEQQRKKCLVVLDDIWSLDAWKSLSPAFPKANEGSKIILTTRNKNVAAFVDQGGFLHEPKCLSKEDSWKLFEKKAFLRTDFTDFEVDERQNLGKEMVEQCKGLPLAIVLLGGLLSTKHALGEWKEVHRSIDSYLKRGKFIGGQDGTVLDVLGLSYQDLPYQLKACFLYLGIYPEDFQIQVEPLYQMWMAEGIVSEEERRDKEETLMDVAERFLGELAQRCMVQVELEPEEEYSPIRGRRRFKYCRIHDLMRDLSLSKGKEENFLQVIDLQRQTEETRPSNSGSKIRRLAIYIDRSSDCRLIKQTAQHIRAVSFFNQDHFLINDRNVEELKSLTKNSKFLRVINFGTKFERGDWAEELPKEIGNLILLRYLGLKMTSFEILPSSIGNLRYLQTLDLRTSSRICIPNVLWKMEGLIHLYLPFYCVFSIEGGVLLRLDGLSKIETIENLASDKVNVRDLFKLTNLQRLTEVKIQEKLEDLETIYNYLLNSKHRLQYTSIEIDSCGFCAEERLSLLRNLVSSDFLVGLQINGILSKLPSHFGQSLTRLILHDSQLNEDPMATLEKLPNLRHLCLSNAFVGKEMVCSVHGFPHLRHLCLLRVKTLEEWKVVEGAMPNLSYLQICFCQKLKMVPDGLKFIATLQELVISSMPKAFEDRLRVVDGKEGEDFHKIQHIHSIQFD